MSRSQLSPSAVDEPLRRRSNEKELLSRRGGRPESRREGTFHSRGISIMYAAQRSRADEHRKAVRLSRRTFYGARTLPRESQDPNNPGADERCVERIEFSDQVASHGARNRRISFDRYGERTQRVAVTVRVLGFQWPAQLFVTR